ncbi:hypothetical protein BgiBS90_033372 [Biomphalaria glabrata]|nr:hypothetical protein BgiBS90_033372 [Biomphalaria glabrata]
MFAHFLFGDHLKEHQIEVLYKLMTKKKIYDCFQISVLISANEQLLHNKHLMICKRSSNHINIQSSSNELHMKQQSLHQYVQFII